LAIKQIGIITVAVNIPKQNIVVITARNHSPACMNPWRAVNACTASQQHHQNQQHQQQRGHSEGSNNHHRGEYYNNW
jgi:hypothetical protein